MNGRIYDPNMARFLQADPFVRDATSPQSLNRYSYVENNPLNATDPTGFFLDKVFKLLHEALGDFAPMRTSAVMRHDTFGKFFQHKSTELWWSVDKAGHGGSVWKVFKGDSEGLHWIADADKAGDFIVGKHKGPTGQFIPWKDLHAVSGWDKVANISMWTAITVMEVIDPTTYIMSPPQDPHTHIPNTELPGDFDGSTEH